MNLYEYSIEELVKLNEEITSYISDYKDGYLYICKVRSYGSRWTDTSITNVYTLSKILSQFDGGNGVVDVYSTNPDLHHLYNYGELMYIESKSDFDIWESYMYLKNRIEEIRHDWDKWNYKSMFLKESYGISEPPVSLRDLDALIIDLYNLEGTFTPPKPYVSNQISNNE